MTKTPKSRKLRQLDLGLWESDADDPNVPPFEHRISSAATTRKPQTRAPASVFDLARTPVRMREPMAQDTRPKVWQREGGRVTGWAEVRRRAWEASERERKSATQPPKTPDAARTKSKRMADLDAGRTVTNRSIKS
jgi:hypothetical protein